MLDKQKQEQVLQDASFKQGYEVIGLFMKNWHDGTVTISRTFSSSYCNSQYS